MRKAIRRQLRLQRDTFRALAVTMLVCWAVGAAGLAIAMHFIEEKVYFQLGTCCALIGTGIMMLFFTFGEVVLYFNVELSMGSTRRAFFVSHFVTCLFEVAEVFALTVLLCTAEEALNRVQYAGAEEGVALLPYLLRFGIPLFLLLVILASLTGVFFMRFGRTVSVTVWFVWMFLCIGVPRLYSAAMEAPDSAAGRIGNALGRLIGAVPDCLWWMLFAAVCAAGVAGTWAILRRQQVAG